MCAYIGHIDRPSISSIKSRKKPSKSRRLNPAMENDSVNPSKREIGGGLSRGGFLDISNEFLIGSRS